MSPWVWIAGLFSPRAQPAPPQVLAPYITPNYPPSELRGLIKLQDIQAGQLFGPGGSAEDRGLQQGAVWNSITLLGDSVGQVPRHVFRRDSEGIRVRLRNHPVSRVVRHPSPNMSGFTFWRSITMHVAGWGNGYAIIHRDGAGSVSELELIHPARVDIDELSDGSLRYRVQPVQTLGSRQVAVEQPERPPRIIAAADMLHILDKSFDGKIGVSAIRVHAITVGAAAAQEEYAAQFFGKAPRISGVLETDKALGVPETKSLRERFKSLFSRGGEHEGSVAVLTNGLKFKELTTVSPVDADYVNGRKLSTAEIAALFRVPTTFLNQLDAATYNNVANLSLGFVRFTLTPLMVNIEDELNRKVVRERDRDSVFVEHQAAALLRSTVKERFEAYQIALSAGFVTGNEVRALENLAPLDGLDDARVPLNMAPATEADEPAPPPESEEEEEEEIRLSYLRPLL